MVRVETRETFDTKVLVEETYKDNLYRWIVCVEHRGEYGTWYRDPIHRTPHFDEALKVRDACEILINTPSIPLYAIEKAREIIKKTENTKKRRRTLAEG